MVDYGPSEKGQAGSSSRESSLDLSCIVFLEPQNQGPNLSSKFFLAFSLRNSTSHLGDWDRGDQSSDIQMGVTMLNI